MWRGCAGAVHGGGSGDVLRIGRTKAYALTQEWRALGGASGLPVVDFGHVLRVPRAALEKLVGADLTRVADLPARVAETGEVNGAHNEAGSTPARPATRPATTPATWPTTRRPARAGGWGAKPRGSGCRAWCRPTTSKHCCRAATRRPGRCWELRCTIASTPRGA